ncbi:replication-relaxation family protein [Streptomyces sp. NPDC050164]|uniref:replication-relaxation family protein n=1 Tax=Streptomyces sp. NPDC050164 TaxID=3365605 RepID=UPI003798A398
MDTGSADRMALGMPTQYRMATTEQIHRMIAPAVRIEQTRRRPARLRAEGQADRITPPQTGRPRVWFPTPYGAQLASKRPELRGHQPSRTICDPTAVRLKGRPHTDRDRTRLPQRRPPQRRVELKVPPMGNCMNAHRQRVWDPRGR